MKLPIPKVYLDLDGVIRDFDYGVQMEFDIEFEKTDRESFITNIKEELNLSSKEIWDRLDIDFVSSLPFTPWAKRLLKILRPYKPIILTAPSRTNATGSQLWIRKRLPDFFFEGRYLIGPCKRACANPQSILIDDYEKHVDEFRANGGHAILFPTNWNGNRVYEPMKIEYFFSEFLNIETKIKRNEGIRYNSNESKETGK